MSAVLPPPKHRLLPGALLRSPILALLIFLPVFAPAALAQGGPPLLTNDPGTPGNGNWEINLGVMQVLRLHSNAFQAPQLDFNYGLGERIQLTYEVPYVVQNSTGQPVQTGWSNGFPGVKWRFFQQDHGGWNISTFPQLEIHGPQASVKLGLADGGTRFLLPFEVTKAAGPIHLDFEAGYFFPLHSPHSHEERILGFAAGHDFTPQFELIGEVYNDSVMGVPPHDTIFDAGGRYRFHKGLLLLFMAGRSFSGNSSGQPEFIGYFGLQILLRKYGRELNPEQ